MRRHGRGGHAKLASRSNTGMGSLESGPSPSPSLVRVQSAADKEKKGIVPQIEELWIDQEGGRDEEEGDRLRVPQKAFIGIAH